VRRIEAGERVAVTAHGRIIAELGPPSAAAGDQGQSRYDELVSTGIARLPLEPGDPLEDWPDLNLPSGTAAQLIDEDRSEA
jgi:antitoxin (DNA-binding transcriptional repressor) of toxin-antitoxin stability system